MPASRNIAGQSYVTGSRDERPAKMEAPLSKRPSGQLLIKMPYFVYKITPPLSLTHVETRDKYQEARTLVRQLRNDRDEEQDSQHRMVFAKNRAEAEKLLSRPRDERVIGED